MRSRVEQRINHVEIPQLPVFINSKVESAFETVTYASKTVLIFIDWATGRGAATSQQVHPTYRSVVYLRWQITAGSGSVEALVNFM